MTKSRKLITLISAQVIVILMLVACIVKYNTEIKTIDRLSNFHVLDKHVVTNMNKLKAYHPIFAKSHQKKVINDKALEMEVTMNGLADKK